MFILQSSTLTAHILVRGATLAGLWHRDIPHSLVLGSPDASVFSDALLYAGAVVGPIANRVAHAQVTIGQTDWPLQKNDGHNCLHGGAEGTHAQDWQMQTRTQTQLTLILDLKHGDMGLPGNRRLSAEYSVDNTGVLALVLRATTDADTMVNLVHHPYWALDHHPTIAQHHLRINAAHYLPTNAANVPCGTITPVDDTSFDFRQSRPVPTDIGIDHNFCLARQRGRTPRHAVELIGATGARLEIATTEPGLQVYNGHMLPEDCVPLHDGRKLVPCAGIALEPQAWPDAPNNPDFPSIELAAGQEYIQRTAYKISL